MKKKTIQEQKWYKQVLRGQLLEQHTYPVSSGLTKMKTLNENLQQTCSHANQSVMETWCQLSSSCTDKELMVVSTSVINIRKVAIYHSQKDCQPKYKRKKNASNVREEKEKGLIYFV